MKKYLPHTAVLACLMVVFTACSPGYVVVQTRPVAPVVVRPVAPSPRHIWIDGDWVVRGGHYVRTDGYWTAPRRGHRWAPGYWSHRRGGYAWVPGHWAKRKW